jgi:hypothetical protein
LNYNSAIYIEDITTTTVENKNIAKKIKHSIKKTIEKLHIDETKKLKNYVTAFSVLLR